MARPAKTAGEGECRKAQDRGSFQRANGAATADGDQKPRSAVGVPSPVGPSYPTPAVQK